MAKITMVDGSVIEGSVEELKQMADLFGVRKSEDEYLLVVDRSARVGDFVKYTDVPGSHITAGKYYEIIRIDSFDDPEIIDDELDKYDTAGDSFEVYEKVSVQACCKETPNDDSLKVGDYVVPLPDTDLQYLVTNTKMKLAEITSADGTERITIKINQHENVSKIGNSHTVHPQYFRKATEEEIAEAKSKAEEHAEQVRWSAIGRKPNEYKQGDIARVEDSPGALPDGTIFEVKSVSGRSVYDEKGFVYMVPRKQLELITPVEQRFDRKDKE